jgi:hypothetical protein
LFSRADAEIAFADQVRDTCFASSLTMPSVTVSLSAGRLCRHLDQHAARLGCCQA